MSKTHWKKLTNPDYLGVYSLDEGQDIIATIKLVEQKNVMGEGGRKEECAVVHFIEQIKPMIFNKTNFKTVEKIHKTAYVEEWKGKKIQIYVDNNVKFGREIVTGLRIRPFIPKAIEMQDGVIKCEECGELIQGFESMTPMQVAQRNQQNYGKALCVECAKKAKESGKVEDVLK